MYEIEQVIKHRLPMRLVDKLLTFDDTSAQTEITISHNSLFFDEEAGGVPSYIGIEYMAQTIAAYAGANDLSKNVEPKLGFLLGTRKYKPAVPFFKEGQVLTLETKKVVQDSSGLSVFDCQIWDREDSDKVLVKAAINVFQPEDVEQYIQGES